MHYDVKVEKKVAPINYYKGDFIIYTNQVANRYIIETLEPQGVDSYFSWNFFEDIQSKLKVENIKGTLLNIQDGKKEKL